MTIVDRLLNRANESGTVFVTADHHFGHANILKLDPGRGIFHNVHEMDEELITRWNSTVSNDDVVIHLGDFALSSRMYITSILKRLNGYLVLVCGNHDLCRTRTFWYNVGFDEVYNKPLVIPGLVVLTHEPAGAFHSDLPNIHGHLHSKGRERCVSVELTDFRPVPLFKMV